MKHYLNFFEQSKRKVSIGHDTQGLQKDIEKYLRGTLWLFSLKQNFRLQAQLAEKESDHSESLKALEVKLNGEIQALKEMLESSETGNNDLQNEVSDANSKW